MGIWVFEVYYSLDHQGWIYSPNHDEHGFDLVMVLIRYFVLVLRKDIQKVDETLKGTSYVEGLTHQALGVGAKYICGEP